MQAQQYSLYSIRGVMVRVICALEIPTFPNTVFTSVKTLEPKEARRTSRKLYWSTTNGLSSQASALRPFT